MKIRLENLQKKIVASERNQPRIYLTKQEAQRFDLARPVLITIEQDDYPVVDVEVIELFNQKLSTWFQQQSEVQYKVIEDFINDILVQYRFQKVFQNEASAAFVRDGKYINVRCPAKSDKPSFPLFGFDDQVEWLKNNFYQFNIVNGTSRWQHMVDFEGIMNDLYAQNLISGGLVARKDGKILYTFPDWSVEPEDVKKCLEGWFSQAQFVMVQGVKYSILFSNVDYFSALNSKEKTWLVGAASPEENGERYYVLGYTAAGVDGNHAYIDVAKAASRMKEEGSYNAPAESSGRSIALVKTEYDAIAALESQLGTSIPVVSRVDYNTFGYITNDNKHVTAIGLYGKNLTSLPANFWSLKSLRTLSLSRNKFTTLPDGIGELIMLETLWLQENKLELLPASIGNLRALRTLNVWNNKLSSLPDSIGNLVSLKDLKLHNNKLASLPESIGMLSALEELHVYSNKLRTFPASIGNLASLQILDARYNSLSSLPASIGQLPALRVLQLMTNQLVTIPESIGGLSSIQVLNIFDNFISSLPDSIEKLSTLKELYLASNPLPERTGKALKALEKQGCIVGIS